MIEEGKCDHTENEGFEAFANEVSYFRKLLLKHNVLFFCYSWKFDDATPVFTH